MIHLPDSREGREQFWNNHILVKLNALLLKKGYHTTMSPTKASFVMGGSRIDLEAIKGEEQIIIKFRPGNSVYHYSFGASGCSWRLMKESRRFRYKNPSLSSMYDIVEYLSTKIAEEKLTEEQAKVAKEALQIKREEEAKEIARALHCKIDILYNGFTFNFITMDGRKVKLKFRLGNDGEVEDLEVEGKLKRHHFYSIIDSLRKSVPDNFGAGRAVRKRRIDLTSDIVTRIAKNENLKNLQFSKIRAWRRNFNLEEEIL
jgi:hypothetical protein